jgi:flagellar biosynthetic protein FlhB
VGVSILQSGFLFTGKTLQPSLNKLSPVRGAKRLFSRRSLVKLGVSIAKILILGSVAVWTVVDDVKKLMTLPWLDDPGQVVRLVRAVLFLVLDLGLKIGAVLLVLALIDYAYQRWQRIQDLRMTKQEVKDELRRMEGDPLMRSRRRQVQQQLAIQRMRRDVPGADVVVTNPTELAVALKYDAETMTAPRVVAKGAGYVARRIREIAVTHGVPIVERKPLAQALFRTCEVGDEIPPKLYRAVAEILAYVYELEGRRPARAV